MADLIEFLSNWDSEKVLAFLEEKSHEEKIEIYNLVQESALSPHIKENLKLFLAHCGFYKGREYTVSYDKIDHVYVVQHSIQHKHVKVEHNDMFSYSDTTLYFRRTKDLEKRARELMIGSPHGFEFPMFSQINDHGNLYDRNAWYTVLHDGTGIEHIAKYEINSIDDILERFQVEHLGSNDEMYTINPNADSLQIRVLNYCFPREAEIWRKIMAIQKDSIIYNLNALEHLFDDAETAKKVVDRLNILHSFSISIPAGTKCKIRSRYC